MNRINSIGKSDVGLRRSNNEDAFAVVPGLGVFSVADGMGGAASGEIASRIFIETSLEVFSEREGTSEQDILESVQKTFQMANIRILKQGTENPDRQGMGCTAELIAFLNQTYVLGHVGDSRTYLFRQAKLTQMTKDHSLLQDQLDQGVITPLEARNYKLRHVIIRAVGIGDTLAVDLVRGRCYPGDIFLLCSDGLTDMVDDAAIEHALSSNQGLNQKGEMLIELAKTAGGYDNITIVLCEVTSE
jgi:serine/threonine protein phosphatase PrpC